MTHITILLPYGQMIQLNGLRLPIQRTTDCAMLTTLVLFVVDGFVALRPKSTAMVIAGRSVHLTTLFPGQA